MKPAIDELKELINRLVPINDLAWNEFEAQITNKTLKKGEILWEVGQTCRSLVFLNAGLVRSFSYINDKEVTHNFYEEKSLFYDDLSFLSQKPCTKSYEALEYCEFFLISRNHLFEMYDRHKSFERLG